MNFIVPPGGFAGYSQMTPASKVALGARGPANGTRRRRKKTKRASRASAARNGKTRASRKLKFGSPAWRKKYNLGKKRRRK